MKRNNIIYFISFTAMLAVASSCARESMSPENADARLQARRNSMVQVRSDESTTFLENTKYRLWAYKIGDSGQNGEYIFDPSDGNGVVATETHGHYIQLDEINAINLAGEVNIYGITDAEPVEGNLDDDNIRGLYPVDGNNTDPSFKVEMTEVQVPSTAGADYGGYTDWLRGYLHYTRGTSPILPFEHIMSRIKVQVIQQYDPADYSKPVYEGLKVTDVKLKGVYDDLVYHPLTGVFANPDNAEKVDRDLWHNDADGYLIDIPLDPDNLVTSLIFPTLEDEKDEFSHLEVTITGEDAYRFSSDPNVTEGMSVTVSIPITDNVNLDNDKDWEANTKPLVFKSNYEYTLQVIFSRDGIVTFRVEVYEWFDGEKDGGNSKHEDGYYEEQILGQPYLFDKLIWSDRNLGAEDYDPVNEDAFVKCVGFYYQYDRNIPYFPMRERWVASEQKNYLEDNVVDGEHVYPVVSNLKYGDSFIRQSVWWYGNDEKDPNKYFNYNFVEPEVNHRSKFITEVDDIHKVEEDPTLFLGYNAWRGGFNTGLWSDVSTQPVPPGWRMPKQEDFFTILPTTPIAGNITFKRDVLKQTNGDVGTGGDYFQDGVVDVIYVHVPQSDEYPDYPEGVSRNDPSKYMQGTPDMYPVEGDPSRGYSSEYIISKELKDEEGAVAPGKSFRWGTIYGIKKVGSNEAYRMRWSIREISRDKKYYVLDIERFSALVSDRLSRDPESANYFRNYDWTRPVAKLSIPIVGQIGDASWNGGQVGNFGSETLLLTSERGSNPPVPDPMTPNTHNYPTCRSYRIKIFGTDAKNQFLYPAEDRTSNGGQIRPVRESTYQPE